MKKPIYYVAATVENNNKIRVHAVSNKDYLPTDIHQYYGERVTTKKALKSRIKGCPSSLIQDVQKAHNNPPEWADISKVVFSF